jgi:hypothetical protein
MGLAMRTKQGIIDRVQGDIPPNLRPLLFNCWNKSAPDFSRFDAIEVSPVARNPDMMICPDCKDHGNAWGCSRCDGKSQIEDPDGMTHCEVVEDPDEADMWSVYGHYTEKDPRNISDNLFGVDCLTDCPTQALAEAIGTLFVSLLPLEHQV